MTNQGADEPVFSPKGCDNLAQGNALGKRHALTTGFCSLKGCHKSQSQSHTYRSSHFTRCFSKNSRSSS